MNSSYFVVNTSEKSENVIKIKLNKFLEDGCILIIKAEAEAKI